MYVLDPTLILGFDFFHGCLGKPSITISKNDSAAAFKELLHGGFSNSLSSTSDNRHATCKVDPSIAPPSTAVDLQSDDQKC